MKTKQRSLSEIWKITLLKKPSRRSAMKSKLSAPKCAACSLTLECSTKVTSTFSRRSNSSSVWLTLPTNQNNSKISTIRKSTKCSTRNPNMENQIRHLTLTTTEIGVLESLLSNPVIGLSNKNRIAFRDYLVDAAHFNKRHEICRTESTTFKFYSHE